VFAAGNPATSEEYCGSCLDSVVLHDWSLPSVAREESRMPRDEACMTGDYCRREEAILRRLCMHSHLYLYIYGLVSLFD
jgi:hypothetical protein